ncbi:DUF6318 family protein [Arthrobacter cavernae]|uniref:DUF6318 domain-containing protein n=1 Tax=Arthrobacter cavernae TaxID=2817681 RepID=A0A939HFQ6_9MICC|nr:DUF6318 family protein [Arthrobacter cavernae]MBO1266660.1 hypothetical protein [Arthrobacter cavernae]
MAQSLTSLRTASRPSRWLRRALAPAASLALLALVLAGCTGSPAPTTSSRSTSAPTATATPNYRPADAQGKAENVPLPVLPDSAKAHTKEGLQAFMKHWVALLSYAYETGDTKPLFEVTGTHCQTCNDIKVTMDDTYSNGGWVSGGSVAYVSADTSLVKNQYGQFYGPLSFEQSGMEYRKADGSVSTAIPGKGPRSLLFLVVESEAGWTLADVGQISTGTP